MNNVDINAVRFAFRRDRARRSSQDDVSLIRAQLHRHLTLWTGRGAAHATPRDWFFAVASWARELLAARWVESRHAQERWDRKRVFYLSMEFLPGRLLTDALRNLGAYEICRSALDEEGHDLEVIAAEEPDAGLGNGGLGRLASCLMDSLATLGIDAFGYGLRFEYGLFAQEIRDGWQIENPEYWLRHGNPWQFARSDVAYQVPIGEGGSRDKDAGIYATAHDIPVSGYGAHRVNTLRLWTVKVEREFEPSHFRDGDHARAVARRTDWESLTRVLYPDDSHEAGRRLRFKQEYFFASASIQDILAQYAAAHATFDRFIDKVAININDTHPALAIVEMMRLLTEKYGLDWDHAWRLTQGVFAYTNHTLMPEALETWPLAYFENMLPGCIDIVYRINETLLREARLRFPDDPDFHRRISLIDEHNGRRVRMAHLAFAGSRKINGVSKIHTGLMQRTVFADLDRLLPGRIVNITNGVTPRRWLGSANPALANLISDRIGADWLGDLGRLEGLTEAADDPVFRDEFRAIKQANKARLAQHALDRCGVEVDVESLFDIHVKRIHEYKRQLLKLLHAIALYNRARVGQEPGAIPRSIVFAGKAASGYATAKLIVKLIHDVARTVNNDAAVSDRLKILFLPNYSVSEAQIIIPAADLSEQISTAGTEASGTGNMKLSLNGALTVGTLDGANIEIAEAVGADNFFVFGLTVEEAGAVRDRGYDPRVHYAANEELRAAVDLIGSGFFSPDEPDRFKPIVEGLLDHDSFLVLADFSAYLAAQERVEALYRDPEEWTRRAILNVARLGRLSSDRAVREYARLIWNVDSTTA